MLSKLRMRLEESFAPLACDCSLTGDSSMTVRLYHRDSGQVDLVVTGLKTEILLNPEAIEALVEELRYELETSALGRPVSQ